jgi:hypothetical protein
MCASEPQQDMGAGLYSKNAIYPPTYPKDDHFGVLAYNIIKIASSWLALLTYPALISGVHEKS